MGQKCVTVSADGEERHVAQVEKSRQPDHDVQPPAEHDVSDDQGGDVDDLSVGHGKKRQDDSEGEEQRSDDARCPLHAGADAVHLLLAFFGGYRRAGALAGDGGANDEHGGENGDEPVDDGSAEWQDALQHGGGFGAEQGLRKECGGQDGSDGQGRHQDGNGVPLAQQDQPHAAHEGQESGHQHVVEAGDDSQPARHILGLEADQAECQGKYD